MWPKTPNKQINSVETKLAIAHASRVEIEIGDLSATYDVPTGKGSPDGSYYGTVIQVFVDGNEINRTPDPRFLFDYID